jgi:transposase
MVPAKQETGLTIRLIRVDGDRVVVEAEGTAERVACPACGARSAQRHDQYHRRPMDLPWRGYRVALDLTVRRFRCANPVCPRQTFAEAFDAVLPTGARRTAGATAYLRAVAQAAGGEAGARLAAAAGVPTSPDTLLRLEHTTDPNPVTAPRVLGVDDLALRRGQRYATVLLDMETHEPVDLLPDRDAATFADWLRQHQGVEIIVRDRAGAYADGARQGAPEARQVADRFHLHANGTNAMQETVRGRPLTPHAELTVVEASADSAPEKAAAALPAPRPDDGPKETNAAGDVPDAPGCSERQARWQECWDRAKALRDVGRSITEIAAALGLSRPTVRKLLAADAAPWPDEPEAPTGHVVSSALRPFLPYLRQRWAEGVTNISELFREIGERGDRGSRPTLWRAVHRWPRPTVPDASSPPAETAPALLSRRDRRWLLLRPPQRLTPAEQALLAQILAGDAHLAAAHALLQRYRALLAAGDVDELDRWLTDAEASQLPAFVSLAHGLAADRAAVEAALTTPWSAGPTEGTVCKIKFLKRRGFGRATFALLRQRVLAS